MRKRAILGLLIAIMKSRCGGRANAVRWEEFSQSGVVRRLNGRDGWAAQRKNFMLKEVVQIPSILKGPNLKSDPQPNIKINDSCPQRQIGGRKNRFVYFRLLFEKSWTNLS